MHFMSLAAMSCMQFWLCFLPWCLALGCRLAAFCCLQCLCQCTRICVTALAFVLVCVVCLTECRQSAQIHVQCLDQRRFADCSLDNLRYRVASTAASFQPEFTCFRQGLDRSGQGKLGPNSGSPQASLHRTPNGVVFSFSCL